MSDNSTDRDLRGLQGFHAIAQQRGDGLLPELAGLTRKAASETTPKVEVTKCEIITLPGLHERSIRPTYNSYKRASALIIEFPVPKWQKNAIRHG